MEYENAIHEMEYLFMTSLHKELKRVINAGIFVKMIDGVLMVTCKNGNDIWDYATPGILDLLINGYNMERVKHEIVSAYRNHVLSLYFY